LGQKVTCRKKEVLGQIVSWGESKKIAKGKKRVTKTGKKSPLARKNRYHGPGGHTLEHAKKREEKKTDFHA